MKMSVKKLVGKIPKKYVVLICIFAVCLLISAVGLMFIPGAGDEAKLYTSERKDGDIVYVDAQFASEEFAYFTSYEDLKLYFVLDSQNKAFIACIPDSELERYFDLQAYTYGEITVAPEVVRTTGTLVETDSDLLQMAVEEFNLFWGEEVVNSTNAKEFFGAYYIDTTLTVDKETSNMIILLLVLSVVMLLWLGTNIFVTRRERIKILNTANPEELEWADAQLQGDNIRHFEKLGVYLTESGLVGYRHIFASVNLNEVVGLYGVVTELYYQLVMRTETEELTVLQTDNKVNKQWEELISLVTAISEKVPGLEYGVTKTKLEGTFDLTQADNFFVARKAKTPLQIEEETAERDGSVIGTNYGAGIAGALAGSLFGAVLWVVVAKLGFIAGIVGYLIVYWALMGFKRGAKRLTKAGVIISLLIAAVMIFLANYVNYALILTEVMPNRPNLIGAMMELPSYLSQGEVMAGFVKDLLMGYGLTLLVSFSLLRNMFGKKKK